MLPAWFLHDRALEACEGKSQRGGENVKRAERLNSLIQNYLQFARLAITAQNPAKLEALRKSHSELLGGRGISPDTVVSHAASGIARVAQRERDLNLELSSGPVEILEEDLKKIVQELVDNAFKYSRPGTPVTGTVTYVGFLATFTPTANLAASTLYTATVTTGVKDLAGNALAVDYTWSFTTSAAPPVPINPLGPAIRTFGSFGGGAGMTNQGLLTVVNGDIGTTGVSTLMTGFHQVLPAPGIDFTVTPLNRGVVNGIVYASDTVPPTPGTAATEARAAYNSLLPAAMPGGIHLGTDQLGGLTLPPGVYQAEGGSYQITGSDLTLNGNATDVWVFQMASSLTVGGPGAAFPQSVKLTGGALAKNVYWQVGSAATINAGGGGTMEGTIIAEAGCVFSTAGNVTIVTLNGRAIGLNASVTLVNTVINIPAP
jgi:hypothetical protein